MSLFGILGLRKFLHLRIKKKKRIVGIHFSMTDLPVVKRLYKVDVQSGSG